MLSGRRRRIAVPAGIVAVALLAGLDGASTAKPQARGGDHSADAAAKRKVIRKKRVGRRARCPARPSRRNGRRVRPRRGLRASPAHCRANLTPAVITTRRAGPETALTPSPQPPAAITPLGQEGDEEEGIEHRVPAGSLVSPRARGQDGAPAVQEDTVAEAASGSSVFGRPAVIGDLVLVRNVSLSSSTQPVAGSLGVNDGREQGVATNGRGLVLYTMNQYAAISRDGGRTFAPLNPTGIGLPNSAGGFCCDQLVTYVPSKDRFVWILQYWRGSDGVRSNSQQNLIRVATATSAELNSFDGKLWPGRYYDFRPVDFGLRPETRPIGKRKGVQLDRPFVAFTRGFLYLTVSAFNLNTRPRTQTLGWRIPLGELGGTLSAIRYGLIGGMFVRPAQNAPPSKPAAVQYFAQRATTSRLNVYEWPDSAPSTTRYEVDVPLSGDENLTSNDPAGKDWLERIGRQATEVQSGARTPRGTIWFAWLSGRETTYEVPPFRLTVPVHDQPSIEFVGLRKRRVTIPTPVGAISVDRIVAVDSESFEYAGLASAQPQIQANSRNEIGVSFMFGGPTRLPSFAVGFVRGPYAQATPIVGKLTQDPNRYGDYVALAVNPRQQRCFLAAGSAEKPDKAGNPFADPHYVVFGRRDSACTVPVIVTPRPGPPEPVFRPDLVVDSITDPRDSTVKVTVRNAGAADAGASRLGVAFGSPPDTETLYDVPGLAPGGTATVTAMCTPYGSRSATARADAGAAVVESDEANNSRTADVSCTFP